jgi:hypothetical protein
MPDVRSDFETRLRAHLRQDQSVSRDGLGARVMSRHDSRRRGLARPVVVLAAITLPILLVAVLAIGGTWQHLPIRTPPKAVASPTTILAVPPPAVAVVHLPTGTARPGQIQVIDVQSGAMLRVLGAEYDPYLQNGFLLSTDRQRLYYLRLNEAAQRIELTTVPLNGGTPQVVPTSASANGDLLASGSFVLDLRPAPQRKYMPPATGTNDSASYAWGRGSQHLMAIDVGRTFGTCPDGLLAPPTPCASPPSLPVRAWNIDASSATSTWQPVHLPPSLSSWKDVHLLGPGRLPGSVLATQNLPGHDQTAAALTLGMDGSVIDRVSMPPGITVLSVDASGTNLLVTYPGGLGWLSLSKPIPIHIGDAVSEASW